MPNLPKKTFRPSHIQEPVYSDRATGDQVFYNSGTWRSFSRAYRIENPLCENCYDKGRLTEAQIVDHIIPIPVGEKLNDANCMSLCHVCHNRKSGKEGHAGGPLIAHAGGLPVDRTEIFKILR